MNFNDYQFSYYLKGSKNLPVLLLLHGFMGNCQDFIAVISQLSERFYCLAVDLPGHGQTQIKGTDDCYNMSNTADAILQFLDSLDIKKCYLLGYSMGGRLALYMALHFPSRFVKVVLESSSPGLRTKEMRSQRLQADLLLAQKLETSDFKDFLLTWYDRSLFLSLKKHPEFTQLIERKLENNPAELAKSLRNLGTGNQPSLWNQLESNQIPILLLVGEYDQKFIAINTEMANIGQNFHLQIISKSGHNIRYENLMDYTQAILEFC